jgi:alkylation response protein AidB-like acyl-CoA dehydrogenase
VVLRALRDEIGDDAAGRPSDKVLAVLHESGVLRLSIPVEHGGLGAGWAEVNATVAALAAVDASVAIIAYLHHAALSRVIHWGTDEQRARLFPEIAEDGLICATSWSEPGAGANKRNIATTAAPEPTGGWRLSGAKSFTTGSGVASIYLVLARTGDGSGASGDYGQTNQGLFVVDARRPNSGFHFDGMLDLAGMRRSATGLIRLDSYLAGPHDMLATSADTPAVIAYPHTLGLTLGAVALGVAQNAYDIGVRTAHDRGLLDNALNRHQIFELGSQLAAVRAVVDAAGSALGDATQAALTAKVLGSESAESICRSVQELAGSSAFSRTHRLNTLAQDARAITLMGPPNHLCRELVATRIATAAAGA